VGRNGTDVAPSDRMQLPYHNLVAWQRADDLFITMHLLSRYISSLTSDTSWGLS